MLRLFFTDASTQIGVPLFVFRLVVFVLVETFFLVHLYRHHPRLLFPQLICLKENELYLVRHVLELEEVFITKFLFDADIVTFSKDEVADSAQAAPTAVQNAIGLSELGICFRQFRVSHHPSYIATLTFNTLSIILI